MEMIINYLLLIIFALSAAVGLFYWAKWAFRHEKEYRELHKNNPDLAIKVLEKQKQKNRETELLIKNTIAPICALLGLLCIIVAIIGPIVTILYQTLKYLKKGVWESLSIIDVMQYLDIKWALMPNDWFGLWNVLDFINIAFAILFIFLIGGIGLLKYQKYK